MQNSELWAALAVKVSQKTLVSKVDGSILYSLLQFRQKSQIRDLKAQSGFDLRNYYMSRF